MKLHLWPNRVDPQIHNLGCQHSWEMYSSFEIHYLRVTDTGIREEQVQQLLKMCEFLSPNIFERQEDNFIYKCVTRNFRFRSLKEHFAKGLKRLNKTGVSRTLLVSAAVRSRVQWQVDANERTETCLLFETCKHFLSVKF